jgi:hypothetical protein
LLRDFANLKAIAFGQQMLSKLSIKQNALKICQGHFKQLPIDGFPHLNKPATFGEGNGFLLFSRNFF